MDRTVGPYQLGETLGTLPFGELVAATHAARSEPLAVLLLDERLAKDIRLRGLLRLEMARAAGLRHPALARTVETGESAGALYLVVERPIGGTTLAQSLSDGVALPADRVFSLVRQLAEGLDAAHARRLLHGAIDPSCILMAEDGSVKLVGLGVLPAAEEAALVDVVVERHGPAFVAPEQTTGPRAVASADDYALGVIAATLIRQQAGGSALSPAVSAVLDRQTASASTARFPSCIDFATALADARTPDSTAAAPPASAVSPPTTAPPTTQDSATPSLAPVRTPSRTEPRSPSPEPLLPTPPANSPAPASEPVIVAPPQDTRPDSTPAVTPPIAPAAPAGPSQPADFGGWVRDIIDPPKGAPPPAPIHPTATPPAQRNPLPGRPNVPLPATQPTPASQPAPTAPSKRAEVSTRTMGLTPAMLDFVKRQDRPDPLGDAVRWVASREPSVESVVDHYAPDGKVGPVPLGVVAAGAVTLLLLIALQFVLATAVVLLVIVLYVMRPLAKRLGGEGQAQLQAVRVRGPAELYLRAQVGGLELYEIKLANGVVPSVGRGDLEVLKEIAQPVPSPWRPATSSGASPMTVQYALSDVTATYLSMSNILLDIRDPDGKVAFRQPAYAGEPGDVLARPQSTAVRRVREPIHSRIGQAQSLTVPIPDDIRDIFQAELRARSTQFGALLFGSILGTMIVWNIFHNTRTGAMVIVLPLLFVALMQGITMNRARRRAADAAGDVSLVRIVGPVRIANRSQQKQPDYTLTLEDGTLFHVDGDTYRELEQRGERKVDTNRSTFVADYTIPDATVTYLPNGPVLLQINDAYGRELYRDRLLKDVAIRLPAMQG